MAKRSRASRGRAEHCFKIEHSNNIKSLPNKLQSQELDYAYIDPFQLITNKDRYIPLLRDKDNTLRGIIVAKKDSEINSLADLDGKMLLLPSPNSFGSSLLTRDALRKEVSPHKSNMCITATMFSGGC